ncbi:MAG: hypothetical protein AAF682_14465 [Planctomycetota bacterium]
MEHPGRTSSDRGLVYVLLALTLGAAVLLVLRSTSRHGAAVDAEGGGATSAPLDVTILSAQPGARKAAGAGPPDSEPVASQAGERTVLVVDPQGRALEGASVHVARHRASHDLDPSGVEVPALLGTTDELGRVGAEGLRPIGVVVQLVEGDQLRLPTGLLPFGQIPIQQNQVDGRYLRQLNFARDVAGVGGQPCSITTDEFLFLASDAKSEVGPLAYRRELPGYLPVEEELWGLPTGAGVAEHEVAIHPYEHRWGTLEVLFDGIAESGSAGSSPYALPAVPAGTYTLVPEFPPAHPSRGSLGHVFDAVPGAHIVQSIRTRVDGQPHMDRWLQVRG